MKVGTVSLAMTISALLALTCAIYVARKLIGYTALVRQAQEQTNKDWAGLSRYKDSNLHTTTPPGAPRVVFLGDSVTERWAEMVPSFFREGRICRGISGQTTPQMLVRFRQDVITLKPDVVHIMAGINDIAGNSGLATDEDIQNNIATMTEIAQAHGIRVVLASIAPVIEIPWKKELKPAHRIERLNTWIANYAQLSGAVHVDYWTPVHNGLGNRSEFTHDGIHPTEAGYRSMSPIAEAAIKKAMEK